MNYDEKLKETKKVFYHASCPDGAMSAILMSIAFKKRNIDISDIKFYSIQYGTPEYENLEVEYGHVFVDICPPASRWTEWVNHKPLVFDHHATSKEIVEGLGGVYRTNESHCGAKIVFDELLSEYYSASSILYEYAQLSMIRDTWKKDHPEWEKACYLSQAVRLFKTYSLVKKAYEFEENALTELMSVGEALFKRLMSKSKLVAESTILYTSEDGVKIGIFNCTDDATSDIANELLNSDDSINYAVGYSFLGLNKNKENVTRISIRTKGDKFSAKEICEQHGGGGHFNAAGFSVKNGESLSVLDIKNLIFGSIRK